MDIKGVGRIQLAYDRRHWWVLLPTGYMQIF